MVSHISFVRSQRATKLLTRAVCDDSFYCTRELLYVSYTLSDLANEQIYEDILEYHTLLRYLDGVA